ncbi:MAG: thrombospondin type 3 repeat-containing protein [Prolixibacteraceae bacterium]|jgi:outer membrane protein OmpA-like peptidoglycan-associated protein
MKKLLLLSLILAFTASLNAQTMDKKWGLGLGVGAYGTITDNGGIGFMPELYLSRYLSPRLDLMVKGDAGLFRSDISSKLDMVNPFVNLRYKFSGETRSLRPYFYAGPGLLWDNAEKGLNFDAGLGAKYYMSSNTAFYMEAGYIHSIDVARAGETVKDKFIKATIGLEFDFGKIKDSDLDGVSDKKDKCPDTPAGVAVDENGCPLDTDGDGVADYIDDCPTIAGLTSLKGCPDADGDGVADKDDKCPDTPKGVKVDATGCPLDQDKDGVHDGIDKCPDTPAGVVVDINGCPVDTDGDGVADYLDECPTVAGPKDNKGCPVIEKAAEVSPEMTIEPVYFEYDKSNILQVEKAKIEKLVKLLKSNSNYNVDLTGNADSKGTEEYNMKLSERRINSVVKAITSSGVKAVQISKQKPLGEANPAATNDTEEGRALNRRVEFEVIKTK